MTHTPVAESVNSKSESCGGRFFKDILEFGIRGEAQKIRLQVVDGKGSVVSDSKGVFALGEAIDLLRKLPLPLSPSAPQWLKDCLGENNPTGNGTSQESKSKKRRRC